MFVHWLGYLTRLAAGFGAVPMQERDLPPHRRRGPEGVPDVGMARGDPHGSALATATDEERQTSLDWLRSGRRIGHAVVLPVVRRTTCSAMRPNRMHE
jgi:hypothetical protein